jgi:hypothetical protein
MLDARGQPIRGDATSAFGNIGKVLIEGARRAFASTVFDVALEGRV